MVVTRAMGVSRRDTQLLCSWRAASTTFSSLAGAHMLIPILVEDKATCGGTRAFVHTRSGGTCLDQVVGGHPALDPRRRHVQGAAGEQVAARHLGYGSTAGGQAGRGGRAGSHAWAAATRGRRCGCNQLCVQLGRWKTRNQQESPIPTGP